MDTFLSTQFEVIERYLHLSMARLRQIYLEATDKKDFNRAEAANAFEYEIDRLLNVFIDLNSRMGCL